MTEQTLYRWEAKYGGMEVPAPRLRELAEGTRLSKLLAENALNANLKEVASPNGSALNTKRRAVKHLMTGTWLSQRQA